MLAAQVTARYGNRQVLEWTLNSNDYGHYAYGAEAAAQLYLGKSVTQLDLSEAALLAATGQTPALNPFDAPATAEQRRVDTLRVMQALGILTSDQAAEAISEIPLIRAKTSGISNDSAPAFVSLVLSQLDIHFGAGRVERGGLIIRTSLDFNLQLQSACTTQIFLLHLAGENADVPALDGSVCEAARLLPALQATDLVPDATASTLLLDPQSGQILAAVGDMTGANQGAQVDPHPAGTSISPFIYLTGFARGLNPATLAWDIPSATPAVGQIYHGPVRLRIALANDYFPPAQNVLGEMGVESVQGIAAPFGLNLPKTMLTDDFVISPLSLAAAYGIFADEGNQVGQKITGRGLQPTAVLQVSGVDHSIWVDWTSSQSQSVVSPQLAYLMNQVLSDEIARWPSLGHPNPLEIGRPVGAKISRTLNSSAGWTVGYTPQRLTVVWLASGSGVASPLLSADLWHALMQYTMRDLPTESWDMPQGIVTVSVCDPSGLLPSANCPNVVNEVFLEGRQPVQIDNLYQTFQINLETGLLATVFTPPELVEAKTYMVVPPQAQAWAKANGIAIPPTAYDTLQTPPTLPGVHISKPDMFAIQHGIIEIDGSATGADFNSYRLEFGQGLYPETWTQIGTTSSTPVTEGILDKWDTSGLDGLYALRLMVVQSDQRVDQAVVQLTLDNTPPQVAISYPQAGQVLSISEESKVALQAQVNEPFLAKVDFFVDGKLVGSTDVTPLGVIWDASAGVHHLRVVAMDKAGNSAEAAIDFSVK